MPNSRRPGQDELVLINLDGTELLGDLFQFNIEALSEKENIDFDKALGQGCSVKLHAYEGKTRTFHGILTQAQWVGKIEDHYHYKVVLRPWFWLPAIGRLPDLSTRMSRTSSRTYSARRI